MKDKKRKYDFNVCIKCQENHKDIPCDKDCKYLKEKEKQNV